MDKRWLALPLLALAAPGLSGCVAVAIPALAGAGMVGTGIDGKDAGRPKVAKATAPDPAPVAAPLQPAPSPAMTGQVPPPAPVPAPTIIAQGPVSTANANAAAVPMVAYPDPARPLAPEQANFARFVRYSQASAVIARSGTELASALLSDPVAVDGKRRSCVAGEQLVAVIDLDPAGGLFNPPANPGQLAGLAFGLAVLRDAGIEIAWLSDLPINQSGAVRASLEKAGLDPRGQDIISLRRSEEDRKQQRRENLAGLACIVAIVGDERPDFDERFKYLRNPEAGAGLEPLIGDGWFLLPPLLGK
jgi:hypothetical protein